MDAHQALTYERRSGIRSIRGRRFRITEPPPRIASVLLTHLGKMLRPWVVRILGGHVTRYRDPLCPQCGATKAEQVNGGRWLCQTPDDTGRPCGTLWERETLRDEQGQPVRLTLANAMADERWRALFALELGRSIDEMDADEAHALAMRMILAGTEWEAVPGQWTKMADEKALDMALAQAGAGGTAVMLLAKAHLEVWALPSLVDEAAWTATAPASSTVVTPGGSAIHEPEPAPSAPAGRAPPRTRSSTG